LKLLRFLVQTFIPKITKGETKKPEMVMYSLKSNTKIVVPTGTELVNIIGEMAGVLHLPAKKETKQAAA
jgi:hypothetical protein